MVFGMIIMRFNLHMKASKCRRGFLILFLFFVIAVSISIGWCMADVVHKILTSFMFYEYALIISLIMTHFSYMCTYTLEKHQQMLLSH